MVALSIKLKKTQGNPFTQQNVFLINQSNFLFTMIHALKNYLKQNFFSSSIREKNPEEAYNIWAKNYDAQPGNLMLDIDEMMLEKLLKNTSVSNRRIADIGCGTGRHWLRILAEKPSELVGFDISEGMLMRLKEKFPQANTKRITNDLFSDIPDNSFELIISTLTLAHIKDIVPALGAWARILKDKSEILITDFHPKTLASGGKRTFISEKKLIAVQNFVHHTDHIKQVLSQHGFSLLSEENIHIDERFRHYYENKDAMKVYEAYKGFPILYGLHFKRS
jgi:ubiquinone/menaquinone biosynthesis C-methylase UbiE